MSSRNNKVTNCMLILREAKTTAKTSLSTYNFNYYPYGEETKSDSPNRAEQF